MQYQPLRTMGLLSTRSAVLPALIVLINHVNGHNKIRLYVIHKVYSSNQLKCCCQQGQQPLSTLVLLSTWSTANINQVSSHYQNICYQPGNSHYQCWLCYLQPDQQHLLTLVLLWSTATINIGCDNNKVNSHYQHHFVINQINSYLQDQLRYQPGQQSLTYLVELCHIVNSH